MKPERPRPSSRIGWNFGKTLDRPSTDEWQARSPSNRLMYPYGGVPDENFQREAWPILTSMRNVDGTSAARVVNVYEQPNGGGRD